MKRSSSANSGSTEVWQFDPDALQPGDVVLERGHGKESRAIQFFDWGRYSHALIWLGGTDFLEAVGVGVRVLSHARFFIDNPLDWLVLRHPDPAVGASAAMTARSFAFKTYDLDGAIATKLPGKRQPNPTAMFCSQVVATAYAKAGAPLNGAAPHKVTPNQLVRDAILSVVDPIPLVRRSLTEAEAAHIVQYRDRDKAYADTNMHRELVASQEVLAVVRNLFPAVDIPPKFNLTSPPGSLGDALNILQFLDEPTAMRISSVMLSELEARDYFSYADRDLALITDRLKQQLAQLSVGAADTEEMMEWQEHYSQVRQGHLQTARRHQDNAASYKSFHTHLFPLSLFKRFHEMHHGLAGKFAIIIRLESELIETCARRIEEAGGLAWSG